MIKSLQLQFYTKLKQRKLIGITTVFTFFICSSFAQGWSRCSVGLPQDTAVLSLAKIGTMLFAGTEHAGVYKSTDGGLTWVTTNLYDPDRPTSIRSMTTIDTFLFAGQSSNGIVRTTLNGTTWTYINNGIPNSNGNQSIFDILAVGDTLYAASYSGGVYISIDKGAQWTILHNNEGLNDLHTLSLAANADYLFVGTAGTNYTMPDTGVAFVTPLTNGDSWQVINNGLARNGAHLEAVSGLTAKDSLVFAGTDDVGIHRSADNGQTWVRIPDTNLNGDIWSIIIVGQQVYYGTWYHGIFTSDDTGLTFSVNNAGLNHNGISIPDLVNDFVVLGPYIYAATSTGVYKQSLNQISGIPSSTLSYKASSVTVFPNPFFGHTIMTIFSENSDEEVVITICDLFGRQVQTIESVLNVDNTRVEIDLHDQPAGFYFYIVRQGGRFISCGRLIAE